MMLLNWPKTSKLTVPKSAAQAVSPLTRTSSGTSAWIAVRARARSSANAFSTGPEYVSVPAWWASLRIRTYTTVSRSAGPIVSSGAW
jgi:hypothetical protein